MKLGNKGSTWTLVVAFLILGTFALAWIGLGLVINTALPSAFQKVQTDYPQQASFFSTIFNALPLLAAAGAFIWVISTSGTPGGPY